MRWENLEINCSFKNYTEINTNRYYQKGKKEIKAKKVLGILMKILLLQEYQETSSWFERHYWKTRVELLIKKTSVYFVFEFNNDPQLIAQWVSIIINAILFLATTFHIGIVILWTMLIFKSNYLFRQFFVCWFPLRVRSALEPADSLALTPLLIIFVFLLKKQKF